MEKLLTELLQESKCANVNIIKAQGRGITHILMCVGIDGIAYKKILYNQDDNKVVKVLKERRKIKKIAETRIVSIEEVDKLKVEALDKLIAGALRDCIKSHGDITPEFIGSATKRISSSISGALKSIKG